MDAYKDGMLTKKGTTATEEKVTSLVDIDRELIEHVLRSDLVLVSPLRRTMATAIIFLAKAKQLLLDADWNDLTVELPKNSRFASAHSAADLPEIRVHADLREKYKSKSDEPGADEKENPLEYVHRIAKQCGKDLFNNEQALDTTYQQIQQ